MIDAMLESLHDRMEVALSIHIGGGMALDPRTQEPAAAGRLCQSSARNRRVRMGSGRRLRIQDSAP